MSLGMYDMSRIMMPYAKNKGADQPEHPRPRASDQRLCCSLPG